MTGPTDSSSAGRLALVGSGEYLPVMHDVEAWLLEGRPRVYVQLATAAATEGDAVVRRWHALGAQAAERLGAEQVVIDVRTRGDADDPRWVEAVRGAGLIYLSGGKPSYLAETLRDSAVWHAIVGAWRAGASLAGCSAGAMVLGGHIPDYRHPRSGGTPGLGVVPGISVLPHFDRYAKWMPDLALRPLAKRSPHVLGIDEDTALVSDAGASAIRTWRATGRQSVYAVTGDGRQAIEQIDLEVAH